MLNESLISLRLPYPGREDRLVRVYLPPRTPDQTLPVIYMTDGQNLFDRQTSTFGCWYTRETIRDHLAETGRGAAVVGIHNDNPLRSSELTPAEIGPLAVPPGLREEFTPRGETFDDFLVHTVLPAVEARFPVRRDRAGRAVCGSSSGGLMAFYTALRHPALFGAAGVLSPAFLLYAPADLERWIRARAGQEVPDLYLYTGAGDALEQDIHASFLTTCRVLEDCWPQDRQTCSVRPDQPHHERAWRPEFGAFLDRFLGE